MTDIVRWIVTVFFLSILLTWCLLNRALVPFDWSPTHDPITVPLLIVILMATLFGFIWGGLIVWLNALPARCQRKNLERTLADLSKKIEDAEAQKTHDNPNSILSTLTQRKAG